MKARFQNILRSLIENYFDLYRRPAHNDAAVDGLRALAILYVVLFHCFFFASELFYDEEQYLDFAIQLPLFIQWVWQGDKGVDLFFVLSGFLIVRYLIREMTSAGAVRYGYFLWRRVLRIVPLYIFVLAVASSFAGRNAEYWWANITFINNILPFEHIFIPWSWSVTVEMQFYLIAPLLIIGLYLMSGRRLPWLLGLLVATFGVRYFVAAANPEIIGISTLDIAVGDKTRALQYWDTMYVNLYTRIGPFLIGALVAYLLHHHREQTSSLLLKHSAVIGLATLASVTWVGFAGPLHGATSGFQPWLRMVVSHNLFGLAAGAVLCFALLDISWGRVVNRVLSHRIWFPISQTSYSIYFFHVLFIGVAFMLWLPPKQSEINLLIMAPVYFSAILMSMILGAFTYTFIERPFLRLKSRA